MASIWEPRDRNALFVLKRITIKSLLRDKIACLHICVLSLANFYEYNLASEEAHRISSKFTSKISKPGFTWLAAPVAHVHFCRLALGGRSLSGA